MTKLTDTQLVILSAASQRTSRALYPLPKTIKLNKAAVTKVLKSLLRRQLVAERQASGGEEVWRIDGQTKHTLVLTDAGLAVLDNGGDSQPTQTKAGQPNHPGSSPKSKAAPNAATKKVAGETKLGQLIELLKRKNGATLSEAMTLTGWQAHSVRGAMSGAIKKRLGMTIVTEAATRGRVYRIEP
ncbi:MAG: DUF3489 domain-containing protein [Alphaproteobacteria bacterium]